ncbi:hypothetical protein [Tropicimonas aquimaris]|uniref:DUF3592 domain-containing protein n=1 Tax=Tropicimonas aquimaris TaxID=914152 RepID=A0ABW3IRF0_9RHOB
MDKTARAPHPQRQISILVALVVAIATPATMALSYYKLTGDPTFRPLALTVERLIAGGVDVDYEHVRAVVHTGDTAEDRARAQRLGEGVQVAFYGKGIDALVQYEIVAGRAPPTVTYHVARRSFGPYSGAAAAQGVRAAVEALRLNKAAAQAGREHSW